MLQSTGLQRVGYDLATEKQSKTKNIGKYMEKLEPLCTVGGNGKWCNSYANQNGGYKILKIELSYYLAPAFLS